MSGPYRIRRADAADVDVLVDFTLREAQDAEGAALAPAAVRRGVTRAFEDASPARYWVAVAPDHAIVASTSVTTEWSNFHGAYYWWIQSLYVHPDHRGGGLVDDLLDHVAAAARQDGALDLRLYVHQGNARARRAYERCGFTSAAYVLMRRRL